MRAPDARSFARSTLAPFRSQSFEVHVIRTATHVPSPDGSLQCDGLFSNSQGFILNSNTEYYSIKSQSVISLLYY